jgi:hypothetical protein
MDAETWGIIIKAVGELTLTGFLFASWWLERSERLKIQAEHEKHMQADIDRLLDQTEDLRRVA